MGSKRHLALICGLLGILVGCGSTDPSSQSGVDTPSNSQLSTRTGSSYSGTPTTGGTTDPAGTSTNAQSSCGSDASASVFQGAALTGVSPAPRPCPSASIPAPSSDQSGIEAKISSRSMVGLFTKRLESVTVTAINHDSKAASEFLVVVFTKNAVEVGLAYKTVQFAPNQTLTLDFPVPSDASGAAKVADDARLEVRDTLL